MKTPHEMKITGTYSTDAEKITFDKPIKVKAGATVSLSVDTANGTAEARMSWKEDGKRRQKTERRKIVPNE